MTFSICAQTTEGRVSGSHHGVLEKNKKTRSEASPNQPQNTDAGHRWRMPRQVRRGRDSISPSRYARISPIPLPARARCTKNFFFKRRQKVKVTETGVLFFLILPRSSLTFGLRTSGSEPCKSSCVTVQKSPSAMLRVLSPRLRSREPPPHARARLRTADLRRRLNFISHLFIFRHGRLVLRADGGGGVVETNLFAYSANVRVLD